MAPQPPPGPRRHTLPQSFAWAIAGLVEAAARERNMRLHLALGVLASSFAAVAPLAAAERALLLLCVALVLAGEAANSALEAAVDLVSPGWDERARVAKDAAAGAVLVLAAGSVVVLLAVALPVLPALAARLPELLPAGAGALAGAVATGLLPAPPRRPLAADVALLIGGAAGLVAMARLAASSSGVAAAALLLAVAAGAAWRRHSAAVEPSPEPRKGR
jgi:diacylglycerol kinase (ATP)